MKSVTFCAQDVKGHHQQNNEHCAPTHVSTNGKMGVEGMSFRNKVFKKSDVF